MPVSVARFWISERRSRIASFSFLVNSFQPVADRFRPASLKVGTVGLHDERLAPEVARMRSLPASAWGSKVSRVSKATGTWPPIRSVSSGAEPR